MHDAGLAIMHGHPLASNPYGLTALTCTWGFIMGVVALTPFKWVPSHPPRGRSFSSLNQLTQPQRRVTSAGS